MVKKRSVFKIEKDNDNFWTFTCADEQPFITDKLKDLKLKVLTEVQTLLPVVLEKVGDSVEIEIYFNSNAYGEVDKLDDIFKPIVDLERIKYKKRHESVSDLKKDIITFVAAGAVVGVVAGAVGAAVAAYSCAAFIAASGTGAVVGGGAGATVGGGTGAAVGGGTGAGAGAAVGGSAGATCAVPVVSTFAIKGAVGGAVTGAALVGGAAVAEHIYTKYRLTFNQTEQRKKPDKLVLTYELACKSESNLRAE